MPTTSNGLPYPSPSDAPNGPDQIKALAEAVESLVNGASIPVEYTPVLTGMAGSAAARYTRLGKLVTVEFIATASGAGTGSFFMSTPSQMDQASHKVALGVAQAFDASVGTTSRRALTVVRFDTGQVIFIDNRSSSSPAVGAGNPWTWAKDDTIGGRFSYWEATA